MAEDVIWLEGRCMVEDADTLLLAMQQMPDSPVDLTGAQRLHLAVVQILLVMKPTLRGTVNDAVLAQYIFRRSDFGWRQID
jgi:hypothetical protein